MNKLKAFTLLEMIVVMILMAIVTGIAFQAYQIIVNQYHSFQLSLNKNNELLFFEKTLLQDFQGAEYIQKTEEGIECVLPDKKVKYNFMEDYVLREIATTDTFFLKVENDSVSFFTKKDIATGGIIQKLTFTVTEKGEQLNYTFTKEYGADVLMRFNP